MRVRLKGLNSVRRRRADGSVSVYYYAWKGGPRLEGRPGTPEFIASYNAAAALKPNPRRQAPDTLESLLDAYESSPSFTSLADRSRTDYRKHLRAIAVEFGDFPQAALSDRATRGTFLAWRDELAVRSRRNADYRFAVFARVLSWAADRGLISSNPLERHGRLYHTTRVDAIWTDDDEAAFLQKAPPHLHLALTLALWTGQRQGDLLKLTWSAYDGAFLRLKQGKTGVRVMIPVGQPLKLALDAARSRGPSSVTILATEGGRSWTESGFRASWRKACGKAGVRDVTFHDLRGTAVTRLAIAGCSVAEIGTITGHSLKDVGSILDSHYLKRDNSLAMSAISKLEARTKTPNTPPN